MKHLKLIGIGLTSLYLTACGTLSPVETTRVVQDLPAIELLAPCPEPVMQVPVTNGALATHITDLRGAIRSCNTDKAALRVWYDSVKGK